MKSIYCGSIDRVVLISDVHYGKYNSSLEWTENINGYFDNFFVPELKKLIADGHTPCVIVAGDYFDIRQHVDIGVLNAAIDTMHKISSLCSVFVIIGNHDIYTRSTNDITTLRALENIPNVMIIPSDAVLECANHKRFLLVSWIGDAKKETAYLIEHKDDADIIVLHSEISGMCYSNGREIINGVNTSTIATKIYSGHIHKRQEGRKATYLGSPYGLDRSDIGNVKGIYVLSIGSSITESFIENTYSPKFVEIDYSAIKDGTVPVEDTVRNNYVDFLVDRAVYRDNKKAVDKMFDSLLQYAPKKLEMKEYGTELVKSEQNETARVEKPTDVEGMFTERVSTIENLTDADIAALKIINDKYMKRAIEELGDTL